MRVLGFMLIFACFAGCSSVTVRTDALEKTRTPPDYQQRYDYWWWGLEGTHSVNVREVCRGSEVAQMQSVATIPDVLWAVATLGIYIPRTARVWCGGKTHEAF